MVSRRSIVCQTTFSNFIKNGWPGCIIVTGQNSKSKSSFLNEVMLNELYTCRNDVDVSKEIIREQIAGEQYPDLYVFAKGKVVIGDEKKLPLGSVRHLLRKFLPYAPLKGTRRFVYLSGDSSFRNEAETALLKSLEEPDANTIFILSVNSIASVKETVASRAMIVPFIAERDESLYDNDPWQRFWQLCELDFGYEWEVIKEKEYLAVITQSYDKLEYSIKDFIVFEELGFIKFKDAFAKEKVDIQCKILKYIFFPLYVSIRDAATEGKIISISPIRLPHLNNKKMTLLHAIVKDFFHQLDTRFFGSRTPHLAAVFFNFMADFMRVWSRLK